MPKGTAQMDRESLIEKKAKVGLNAVSNKAANWTDWRAQVDKHPMLMMGVAFGGGLLLGTAIANASSSSQGSSQKSGGSGDSPAIRQASQILDHMKGALVGVASAKLVEFLDGVIPGFQDHYSKHSV